MCKVTLEEGYREISFEFHSAEDACDFIHTALRKHDENSGDKLKVVITYDETDKKAGEADA